MSEQGEEPLHGLLLPLVGRRLLVPRACVAEVIGLGRMQLREEEPEWLLGEVAWGDRLVPLVSFEAACGDPVPEISGRTRAVIVRSLTGRSRHRGLAILCQGLPQLLHLSADGIATADGAGSSVGDDDPVLCRVALHALNEVSAVPDLEKLEAWVGDILQSR